MRTQAAQAPTVVLHMVPRVCHTYVCTVCDPSSLIQGLSEYGGSGPYIHTNIRVIFFRCSQKDFSKKI